MYPNVSNINYQQFYQPPTETCHQQLIQNVAPNARFTYQQNMKVNIGYCHNQRFGGDHHRVLLQPVWMVHPPYHHPLNTQNNIVSVTYAHMMTVQQTANWIRTLSIHKGWEEAVTYATIFRKNEINGEMLRHLNHEILRFDIGISNYTHRLVLMNVIRQLFPSLNKHQVISEPTRLSDFRQTKTSCARWQETSTSQMAVNPLTFKVTPCALQCLVPNSDESIKMDLISAPNNSAKSISTKSGSDMEVAESKSSRSLTSKSSPFDINLKKIGNNTHCTMKETSSFERALPMEKSFGDIIEESERHCTSAVRVSTTTANGQTSSKLLLTLPRDNILEIEIIRDRFKKLNFVVSFERVNRRCFVLIFQSPVEAMRALNYQCKIGYKLDPYRDMQLSRRHSQMRATKCQVLSTDTVTCDKSLQGQFLGTTDEGEVVTINKSKGHKTIVVHKSGAFCDSGAQGWVSLHSKEGIRLLKELSRRE